MVKTFAHLIESEEYYFDAEAVQRVIEFIETFCKLADPMGQPFILLPWERQIVNDVFGWYSRETDERRFVYVYIEVPRKNGKTYFVAALLLYLLMADGTLGGEVYASACSREQSGLLYKSVVRMITQSKFLTDRLSVVPYKSEVKYGKGDSVLKALSGESVGSHGKYPSAVVCDELHEWQGEKADGLYEALTTGFGDRKSPLVIHITTAGFGSQPTLAKRLHEKALKFAEGTLEDPTFYGVVYGASPEDDWTDEEVWKKANPSWERSLKNLRREFKAAKAEPSKENSFKRLYLNIWTQQQTRWLSMESWRSCLAPLDYEKFKGKEVVLGLDLSQIYDLTALTLNFPEDDGKWRMFVRNFMPSQQVARRSLEDSIPYDVWAKGEKPCLIPTNGVSQGLTIDYDAVVENVVAIANECRIVAVGYDPANAVTVVPQLEAKGINCIPIYQSYNEMSPASKEFERRLTSGLIEIQDNACLTWQAGNVEIAQDSQGRIRPTKPNAKGNYGGKAKHKVDGIVASIIATQATLLTYRESQNTKSEKAKVSVFYIGR